MESAIFEIDRTKKGGQALYGLLINSLYAKLIKQKNIRKDEYTFYDLNEVSKRAFVDADTEKTHKSKDLEDLFEQLEI
jgi:hypothetical protein